MQEIRFLTLGETGMVVEFGNQIDPGINSLVHALARRIGNECGQLIEAVVPTYRSLLIFFDPLLIKRQDLKEKVTMMAANLRENNDETAEARIVIIPTLYGGDEGPDLEFVAEHNNLEPEDVIRIHSSVPYRIYMMGFTPGFPYLGGMAEMIATPRLKTPRTKIPAGSVGIAGTQTGLYPVESPGGWQLIGRTPLKAFDPLRERPFLYTAGDYLKFISITPAEYSRISREVVAGRYQPETLSLREANK